MALFEGRKFSKENYQENRKRSGLRLPKCCSFEDLIANIKYLVTRILKNEDKKTSIRYCFDCRRKIRFLLNYLFYYSKETYTKNDCIVICRLLKFIVMMAILDSIKHKGETQICYLIDTSYIFVVYPEIDFRSFVKNDEAMGVFVEYSDWFVKHFNRYRERIRRWNNGERV